MLTRTTQEKYVERIDALVRTIGNEDARGQLMDTWDPDFGNASYHNAHWYARQVGELADPLWWLGLSHDEKCRRINHAHDEYLAAAA